MMKFFSLVLLMLLASLSAGSAQMVGGKQPDQVVLKASFDKPFPLVYKAIKQTLESQTCRVERDKYQEDEKTGLFKANITSEFCVFVSGEDSTETYLERYSFRVPYIRGASWTSGRIQYKIRLMEKEDGNTELELRGEVSGFEEHVTHATHFWTSNGVLEQKLMDLIKENIAAAKTQ